jgi:hypothetical protein
MIVFGVKPATDSDFCLGTVDLETYSYECQIDVDERSVLIHTEIL